MRPGFFTSGKGREPQAAGTRQAMQQVGIASRNRSEAIARALVRTSCARGFVTDNELLRFVYASSSWKAALQGVEDKAFKAFENTFAGTEREEEMFSFWFDDVSIDEARDVGPRRTGDLTVGQVKRIMWGDFWRWRERSAATQGNTSET